MDELEKRIVELFKEEHQDWVQHIKDAEENNEGIDINLGGSFADRLEKVLQALRDFRARKTGKKSIFGR